MLIINIDEVELQTDRGWVRARDYQDCSWSYMGRPCSLSNVLVRLDRGFTLPSFPISFILIFIVSGWEVGDVWDYTGPDRYKVLDINLCPFITGKSWIRLLATFFDFLIALNKPPLTSEINCDTSETDASSSANGTADWHRSSVIPSTNVS